MDNVTSQKFCLCIYALCFVIIPFLARYLKLFYKDEDPVDRCPVCGPTAMAVVFTLWTGTFVCTLYMDYRTVYKTLEHRRHHDFVENSDITP